MVLSGIEAFTGPGQLSDYNQGREHDRERLWIRSEQPPFSPA